MQVSVVFLTSKIFVWLTMVQEQKCQLLPNTQNSSSPNSTLAGGISVNISGGKTATVPPQPHTSQEQPPSIQQHLLPDLQMSAPDSFWESLLNSDLPGAYGELSWLFMWILLCHHMTSTFWSVKNIILAIFPTLEKN